LLAIASGSGLGGLVKVRVFSRALAVTAVTALGAAGLAGAAHASAVPSTAKAAVKAAGAVPYDFNGDGYPDLALGDPYGTVGSVTTAGFVTIVYGSASGLNTAKHTVISQSTAGVPGTPESADHFGLSLTSLDYDEDGYADLLVGAPDEDTTDGANAGSETILWGSASGLNGTGSDAISEPGTPGAQHRFGFSLTAADFDGDGHTDWVDTAPGDGLFYPFKNPGPELAARAAGGSAHPFVPKAQPRKVRSGKANKAAAADDSAVTSFTTAAGDIDGDGKPDLAIGWLDAESPTSGFDVWNDFTEDGESDANEVITRVDSLAIGDFDGDGNGDVAVGGADESNGVGGHVTVYKGDADVTLGTTSTIDQSSTGLPGSGVSGDRFGYSVAAGDINKDGKSDLAIGVPLRSVSSLAHAGEAIVLYGADGGLSGTGSQVVSQDTAGVPGAAEAEDEMGWTVNLFNPNADGYFDLIAGAPKENGTDGAVSVLPGTATGLTTTGSATWGAGTIGTSGKDAQVGVRQGRIG
jgi:FG-GAP repeat/FG-GAP-like repeat